MFERFPSLTRFSHGWTITEKLDGTNAAIIIVHASNDEAANFALYNPETELTQGEGEYMVFAQSRSKLIWPGKSTDNHGFARYVADRTQDFVDRLGEGRHFGEWVGPGISKRHYNLKEKQFALFNVGRWAGAQLPERTTVVPTLLNNQYLEDAGTAAVRAMAALKEKGSQFGEGFMNPEGVVMYHGPSKTSFKKTFEYDERGKWAENQERRGNV